MEGKGRRGEGLRERKKGKGTGRRGRGGSPGEIEMKFLLPHEWSPTGENTQKSSTQLLSLEQELSCQGKEENAND